jgi:hypothetical protein
MHALGLLDGVADAEVTGFLLALVVGNFSGDVLEGASPSLDSPLGSGLRDARPAETSA